MKSVLEYYKARTQEVLYQKNFEPLADAPSVALESMRTKGYYVWENYYSSEECSEIRSEIDRLITENQQLIWKDDEDADNRVYFAERLSDQIKGFSTDSRFHKEIEHFLAELLKAIKGSKNPKAKSLASRVKSAQGIAKKFTDIVGVRGGHSGGALGRNEGKLNEDYSQRARNFRVNLRTRLKAMKKNETVGIGKMIFSKMVDGNFQITKTGKVFGLEEVVQAIQKGPARPYIKTHRGAAGADMVNAYVKFGK